MRKLRVAIIGQGRSGRDIHGAYFRSGLNDKFEVVAVAEEIPDRRERAKAEYGCEVYSDYRELLRRDDLDLVVNSSFSHLHYPITMDLLSHGFNVVVEKPFSAHKVECENMIKAAKSNGKMLSVFQQSHFAPYFKRIREILAGGELGRPVQITVRFNGFARRWDWQCSQRYYGGSLRNTGPHPVEQILTLVNYDSLPAIASRLDRVNTFGDAEDYVKILMLAPGKPVVDLEISSCDAYSEWLYQIQCQYGCLRANAAKVEYQYYRPDEQEERSLIMQPLRKDDGTPKYCGEELHWHKETCDLTGTAFDVAVREYYDNIYSHLTRNAELIIKPENLLMEIELFEETHRQNPLSVIY